MKIPAADLVPRVIMLISEKWQQFWNRYTGNKLQTIRPTVGGHHPKSSLSRLDEVVVNRLRIGHTRCTHSYLLTGADQSECTTCQCPLTVGVLGVTVPPLGGRKRPLKNENFVRPVK